MNNRSIAAQVGAHTNLSQKSVRRGSRQARHLSQAIILEETGSSAIVRQATLLIAVSVALFIGWAALARLDEVAVTNGEIVPSSAIQTVQHLEGGVVAEILVKEGQLVSEGQILFRLAPKSANSEFDQMKAREVGLALKSERLRAYLEDRNPDFSFADASFSAMVADQKAILAAQRLSRSSALAVTKSQVDQRRSEIRQYEESLKGLSDQVKVLEELVAIREQLEREGLVSRVIFLDTKRSYVTTKGDMARIEQQLAASKQALTEAENRLRSQDATLKQDASNEMGAVAAELAQVHESLAKLSDRVDRLDVVAPKKGLVQDLKVRTVGAVIAPGGTLCQVVPVEDNLQLEVRIQARDIGHLKPNLPATVKMTTYEFARYGTVPGRLQSLSPTSFQDDKGNTYFKGIVTLNRNYVGEVPGQNVILPGMTAQADVETGDKTLLEYLLKPIFLSLKNSFHER
ncbi:MAG: HlyD family type I secretion periplasmic adaptor subunit [Alphaproteobacteria bacterium]|nr:HlyD family type I secretion periplasmic adaptor subunit [Alphaproteobacteria bacterium]